MACLGRASSLRHGQSATWVADLDHHLHDNDLADPPLCPLLDKLDIYDELHYFVLQVSKCPAFCC